MKPAAKPYSLEERLGSSEGTVVLAVVYEHRAASQAGKYVKLDTYVVTDVTPDRYEGIKRSLQVMIRIANEGFQNGWNLREFQLQLDGAASTSVSPAVLM